jgi:Flp pilus assembly protein TadD
VLGHATSLLVHEPASDATAEEALASVRTALSLAPDDPLVHHCHAALLANLGRTPDATRAWERALALDPNSAGARAGLGITQIFLKQPESALGNIDAALRLSPRDPITYHWLSYRALACILLGRWHEAGEAAQESVQRTGTRMGYVTLAAALAHLGRLEEARAAYAELTRLHGLDIQVIRSMLGRVAPDPESERLLGEALDLAAAESQA